VVQAFAVFNHIQLLWMIEPNMAIVLLDPGFNRMVNLSNVNYLTLAGDAYMFSVLRARSFLMGQKKLQIFVCGMLTILMCSTSC
jgi:hypothetical protein